MRFRSGLRLAVVGSGLPYGYTLTTFASGQSVIHVHGSPAVGLLLLVAAGAGAAAGALRATTRGLVVPVVHLGESPALMRALVVQTVAVGGAVLAAAAAAHLPELPAWPVAGFASTAIYLAVVALELTRIEGARPG